MGNPSSTTGGDRRRLTVPQAAEALGVTVDAIRGRIRRGTIEAERDESGTVYVWIEAPEEADSRGPAPTGRGPSADQPELVEDLRNRVRHLESQLDVRTEELREHRRLLAAALERMPPAIEAPARETPPESPETAEPVAEGVSPRSGAPAKSSTRTVAEGVSITVLSAAILTAAVKVVVPLVVAVAALVVAGVAALNGQFYAALASGVTSLAATLLGYLIFRWQAKRESQRAWNDIAQEALGFDVAEVSVRPPSDTPGSPETDADEPGGGSGPSR